MKKHYIQSNPPYSNMFDYLAACDRTLKVPHTQKKKKSKRLTREQVLSKLDDGSVCTACKRIAIVERLNGNKPQEDISTVTLPLPIIHKDFSYSARKLMKGCKNEKAL